MATKNIFEHMDTLRNKSYDEKLAVVYMWIKSGVISKKEFVQIMMLLVDEGAKMNQYERDRDRF